MPRSHSSLFIASLLTLTYPAAPTSAACHTQAMVQNNNEITVAVPFAVPVGVPVAPLSPYFYGYQQIYSPIPQSNGQTNSSDPIAKVGPANDAASVDQSKSNPSQSAPPFPSSLVVTTCAKCHGGQAPKAGLSLEHPEALNTSDRLRHPRSRHRTNAERKPALPERSPGNHRGAGNHFGASKGIVAPRK